VRVIKMTNTKKEFLEWKIDFMENLVEMLNAPLEAGHVPAEDIEHFKEDIRNAEIWIKELKSGNGRECMKNLKWKINFLKLQLENVNMNLEFTEDEEHREFLYYDSRSIKAWIKELKKMRDQL